MSKITKEALSTILTNTGLDNILLFDLNGDLIESNEFEYDGNFAAMCGVLSTMCKELIQDLEYGNLQKIIIHANEGVVMINEYNKDYYIASFTKDSSKLGLLSKTLDSFINNIALK